MNNKRSINPGPTRSFSSSSDGGEETLKSDKIQIERKTFLFALKENPRGRFLRITEDVGGRRDAIIIPATGLVDFARIIEGFAQMADPTVTPENSPQA